MITIHRITTGIVLALALGTSAAPATARTFNFNRTGSMAQQPLPRRCGTQRVFSGKARTLPCRRAATTPPSAFARFELNPSPRGVAIGLTQVHGAGRVVGGAPDQQILPAGDPGARHDVRFAGFAHCPRVGPCAPPDSVTTQGSRHHSSSATAVSPPEAFQWGDAGIGAAGMLLLVAAGGGVAVATRRQRHRVSQRHGVPAS
jgi:hypothetical protein